MESSTIIGFQGARLTKYLLSGLLINSTLSSILDLDDLFSINILTHLWNDRQIWRLGIWQFACGSFTELLFASLALYKLSAVERLMGTRKFASFLALTIGATSVLVPFILGTIVRPYIPHANILASGLTPTIFTILHQYHAHVPAIALLKHEQRQRDIKQDQAGASGHDSFSADSASIISDKTLMYAIGAQIAIYRTPGSLVGAALGWILGMAYHRLPFLNRWRIPESLSRMMQGRPVGVIARDRTLTPHNGHNGHNGSDATISRPRSNPRTVPVSIPDTDIETLVNMMSVSHDMAREALIASGGSIERAVDNLLLQ